MESKNNITTKKKLTQKQKKKTEEKKFEELVREFLDKNGIYHFKFWGGNLKTSSGNYIKTKIGVPDLICNINGIFVGLEIKQKNGHPSEEQIKNLCEINKTGGLGFLVYPKDFKLLQICIKKLLEDKTQINIIRTLYLQNSNNF